MKHNIVYFLLEFIVLSALAFQKKLQEKVRIERNIYHVQIKSNRKNDYQIK